MDAIARDWRSAALSAVDAALCAYAEKVTTDLQAVGQAEIDALRRLGLSDQAIHDAVQVVGYFNYINRIADALGVEYESFVRPWGE